MPDTKKTRSSPNKQISRMSLKLSSISSIKLFYVSVSLLLLALGLSFSAVIINRQSQKKAVPINQFSGVKIGTPVTMGVSTMELTKVSFSDGQPGFTAPEGKHYVIVDLLIKNNADHPINVLPSSDTYIKNEAGKVSYLTPFVVDQPFRAGGLLPGEQIKGQLSYLVDKTVSLKLFIDSIWSGGVVSFKIQ
jgi:hypothetical protein